MSGYMEVSEHMLALAFADWERRARANPEEFATPEETAAQTPEEMGADSARYLYDLLLAGPSYTQTLMSDYDAQHPCTHPKGLPCGDCGAAAVPTEGS